MSTRTPNGFLPESQTHTNLWAAAVALFGLGDLLTTIAFISLGWAVESHPFAAGVIGELGLLALVPLKLAAFGVCLGVYRVSPDSWSVGVPLGLTLLGGVITAWNVYISVFARPVF